VIDKYVHIFIFQMDKFIELIHTRAWTYSPAILSAMFRVFCSIVICCHDQDTLLSSASDFLDAFFGDPGFVAGNVLTNYITLQLLIDTGTYLEDNEVFLFICDMLEKLLQKDGPPTRDQFHGSDDFWQRYHNVSNYLM